MPRPTHPTMATATRLRTVATVAALAVFTTVTVVATASSAAYAAPTPSPTPDPSLVVPGGGGDPGWFDIGGQIRKAMADFLAWVAQTGLSPVLRTLGDTVLATPDLTSNPQVRGLWTGSLVVANALLVLVVVAGGFTIAARDTLQSRHGLKEIAPRLVVGAVAANVSLIIAGKAIEVANAITTAIVGQGVDGPLAVTAITNTLHQAALGTNFLFSVLVLAVLVLAIIVVITFVIRVAILVLLIGAAPLALLCHALPQTEGLAYVWWRAMGASFAIQITQALILLATVKVFLTPVGPTVLGVPSTGDGLLGLLVCVTMLWLLIKVPGMARRMVLGPLTHGRSLIGQVLTTVAMVKTIGATSGAAGRAASTAAASSRATPRNGATVPATPTRAQAPAGPPTPLFSHAPAPQTTAPPARPTNAPAFSHPRPADTPLPRRAGTSTPQFSHPPTTNTRQATNPGTGQPGTDRPQGRDGR